MKYYFLILLPTLLLNLTHAQTNTEVFLFDLNYQNSSIELLNGENISKNEGYDNQPSFLNKENILFSSNRNGQTDIAQYHIDYKTKTYINFTEGSEYTPLKIPKKYAVSAVRLDKDGKQRLYSYNLSNGESTELISDMVVAYYTWFDVNTIIAAVIEDEQLNLYVINLSEGTKNKYATNVGRSIHKIPNSNLVSFIYKEGKTEWQIRSLNPKTGVTKLIAYTIPNVEDICWLDEKTLLSSEDNSLFKLTLKKDNNWKKVKTLSNFNISKITRLTVNPEVTQLLIAGDVANDTNNNENSGTNTTNNTVKITEKQASQIVEKHIEPFNTRRLNDFVNAFDEDVVVNRFPKDYMYSGRKTLKNNYQEFFKNNKKSNVKVLNRIVHENYVIDEELVTINNMTIRQATIYDVDRDNINSMTFVRNRKADSNPEIIVNTQLEAYNNRDIEEFAKTYTEDVTLHIFPETLTSKGNEILKQRYDTMFKSVPDLNAEIINRIVIGNKVIDQEKVTANGKTFYAIAIYEVKNNLIHKVTFIQ